MKIYDDLAKYWPSFSSPEEYVDEARVIGDLLDGAAQVPLKEVLELALAAGTSRAT